MKKENPLVVQLKHSILSIKSIYSSKILMNRLLNEGIRSNASRLVYNLEEDACRLDLFFTP